MQRSAPSQCRRRILVQVNVRSVFQRNHALRWIVPTGVVGVAAIIASGVLSAQAISDLPPRTAAQLLVDVEKAHVDGLSGTIVAKASLGIPALPSGAISGNLLSLLSGSHTARVWYAGTDKQRFALLDTLSEADVFHNGRDIWTYNSSTHDATHMVLPAQSATQEPPATTPTLTPEQAAEQALRAIDPTTIVSTDAARRVAGRAAYDLVLVPRDPSSRIGSVRIAIDGNTKIPLGVQLYARGDHSPAVDVAYTRIRYSVPDMSNFTFTPAKSVKIKEAPFPAAAQQGHHPVTTIGTGWTTVVRMRVADLGANGAEMAYLQALPRVSWAGGSGRLFDSRLVTVLVCDDGRLYAGPVDKSVLIADAAARK
jgi:outer membrane lipoprotein-sorting protein